MMGLVWDEDPRDRWEPADDKRTENCGYEPSLQPLIALLVIFTALSLVLLAGALP